VSEFLTLQQTADSPGVKAEQIRVRIEMGELTPEAFGTSITTRETTYLFSEADVVRVDGTLAGTRHRKTLKTRNWDTAQKLAQYLEAPGKPPDKRVKLLEACTDFERDAEIGPGLRPSTLKKYKLSQRSIPDSNIEFLRKFRESWQICPLNVTKRLEHLRSFFRFSPRLGVDNENPSTKIKPPKVD